MFAIEAAIADASAASFMLAAQKTMHSGKRVAERDDIVVFASENEGGAALVQTEINFTLCRQATNKIVGISDGAAAFLRRFF